MTEVEALAYYYAHRDACWGRPRQVAGEWVVTRKDGRPAIPAPSSGQARSPPSPGGSDKAARLKPQDRPRIAAQAQVRADRNRRDAEREAEERRRREAQGSIWDRLEGS